MTAEPTPEATSIANLRALVETGKLSADWVATKTQHICTTLLKESPHLDGGNFTKIHTSDLERLFSEYDRCFFKAQIRLALGDTPLRFRLSKRMTRAGGKLEARAHANRPNDLVYRISVSTTLLFECFLGSDHRPITVSGITCHNRMEALQRVMEHELVHLLEMLLWTKSSCASSRFQSIASRFFGHRQHTHELITPRERALAKFGIKPGAQVRFLLNGVDHLGIVNRITKRATVLVKSVRGRMHTDGNRYLTCYVPVELLEVVDASQSSGKRPFFEGQVG